MPTFPESVERWRAMSTSEIARQGLPFPTELILSVIKKESGGSPSAISSAAAMGLMQVMPGTLRWYNDVHKTNHTDESFKANPALQIRVGTWVLKTFWRSAYAYLIKRTDQISLENLSKTSSLFYVAGPGRARSMFDRVQTPTYQAFAATYPNFDPVKNGYADKIWQWAADAGAQWDPPAIDEWLGGGVDGGGGGGGGGEGETMTPLNGALLAVICLAGAWMLFNKGKK